MKSPDEWFAANAANGMKFRVASYANTNMADALSKSPWLVGLFETMAKVDSWNLNHEDDRA